MLKLINSGHMLQLLSLRAEMGKPSTLLVALQLLSYCIGLTTAEQGKYWVAPAGEKCDARKNCTTLEEYARTGAFSRSNVVWIFEEGKHTLNGGIVSFSEVHNVSLTGNTACEQSISNCTIHCEGEQACMFLFVASSNITISNLRFIYQDALDLNPVIETTLQQYLPNNETLCYNHTLHFPTFIQYSHFENCICDRSWVFVDVVNVTVSSVTFIGRNSYWAVVRPNGNYRLLNCKFHELFLAQSSVSGDPQHYLTVVLKEPQSDTKQNQGKLTFLIANSHFHSHTYLPSESFNENTTSGESTPDLVMAYPVVHIISDELLNGWKASITIEYCHFLKCSPFQLTAIEDIGLTVTLNAVTADGNSSALNDWQQSQVHTLMGSAIRLFLSNYANVTTDPSIHCSMHTQHLEQTQCATNSSPPLSNVTVTSSQFKSFASEKGCIFLLQGRVYDGLPKRLRIVLHNNTFKDSHSQKYRSVVYVYRYHRSQGNHTYHQMHTLVIDSNVCEDNFAHDLTDQSCVVFDRTREGYSIRPGRTTFNSTCQDICIWQGVYYIHSIQQRERVLFTGNTVRKNNAQGLTVVGSVLELEGENWIHENRNYYGGGVALHGNSQLFIKNGSHLSVSNNSAFVTGGGIFIHNSCTVVNPSECPCFFQFIGSDGRPLTNTSINTFNASALLNGNTAFNTANMIFNANSDHCILYGQLQNSIKTKLFHQVFGIPTIITQEDISSTPQQIRNCSYSIDGSPKCSNWSQDPIPVHPGQNVTLNVMLIGDMEVPLESVLYVYLEREQYMNASKQRIPLPLHSTHLLSNSCNSLIIPALPISNNCAIRPKEDDNNLVLQLMVQIAPNRNQSMYLTQYLPTRPLPCPPAYTLVGQVGQCRCVCCKLLRENQVQCLLDKQIFLLPQMFWIGTEEELVRNYSQPKVLLSTNCPKVYCATANSGLSVSLRKPDKQCKHERTGVLCGQCPNGKSVVYNSYACKDCTNWSILLLIPLLIAGPVLIALICCLNLTISVGTINGFLFYLNIISINREVLTISTGDSTLGIQALAMLPFVGVCFYDGMDEFASMLLTYLFPVYLLTLVGLICLLPKCKWVNMHKINRRIGPRITPVLSTIILLSYTQLAESVVRSLLFVKVHIFDHDCTNTTLRLVWMFDGSLEYFHSPKHIVLACLALLVLMCFLLPVTVISIFGDLFRRFSRGPWYMNFLDSFHGAFRFRFGFWIGIRILLRILFIVLKIFLPVNTLFLVIAYTIMTLLFLQILIRPFRGIRVRECVSKKIKEKHFSEPLQRQLIHSIDHSFLVHLIAVFMALPHDVQNVTTVLIVSRVIAYVELAGILVYHMMEYSPVGPFVFDTWFKLQRRYRRWRENRREATLARTRHRANVNKPSEEKCSLILRASDCRDSDYEDESESDDDSTMDTTSDKQLEHHMPSTKQGSGERDNWSGTAGMPVNSGLATPLVVPRKCL